MEKLNLENYPVQVRIDISWSDLDALGIVNNVIFYRYFEKARFEYYARLGLTPGSLPDGTGPVLASSSCRYLSSLTYPDTITVGAHVRKMGKTSMAMEFLIVSDSGGIIARGETIIVMMDFTRGVKSPLPASIREAVKAMENREKPVK